MHTEQRSRNQSGARPVPGRSLCRGKGAAEIATDLRSESALQTPGDTNDLVGGAGRSRS